MFPVELVLNFAGEEEWVIAPWELRHVILFVQIGITIYVPDS